MNRIIVTILAALITLTTVACDDGAPDAQNYTLEQKALTDGDAEQQWKVGIKTDANEPLQSAMPEAPGIPVQIVLPLDLTWTPDVYTTYEFDKLRSDEVAQAGETVNALQRVPAKTPMVTTVQVRVMDADARQVFINEVFQVLAGEPMNLYLEAMLDLDLKRELIVEMEWLQPEMGGQLQAEGDMEVVVHSM